MAKPATALAAAAFVLASLSGTSAAAPAGTSARDQTQDCSPTLPASTAPEVLTGAGDAIALDVLVLHDGIEKIVAEQITQVASASYAPLDIVLTPTFKKFDLTPAPETQVDVTELIARAKTAVGGKRPATTDAVFVLSDADLVAPEGSVAGYSDCTGGIRYADRAFAVGEAIREESTIGPLHFFVDDAAKIMAHELGHLLGARHDYANCVQGISLSDITSSEGTPCTLMTQYADFMSSNFGSLEAVVVRGYAEDFADS